MPDVEFHPEDLKAGRTWKGAKHEVLYLPSGETASRWVNEGEPDESADGDAG